MHQTPRLNSYSIEINYLKKGSPQLRAVRVRHLRRVRTAPVEERQDPEAVHDQGSARPGHIRLLPRR